MYHPKLIGFEHFSKTCKTRSTDYLETTSKIILSFHVLTDLSKIFYILAGVIVLPRLFTLSFVESRNCTVIFTMTPRLKLIK